jgi:hypothetical protein
MENYMGVVTRPDSMDVCDAQPHRDLHFIEAHTWFEAALSPS